MFELTAELLKSDLFISFSPMKLWFLYVDAEKSGCYKKGFDDVILLVTYFQFRCAEV